MIKTCTKSLSDIDLERSDYDGARKRYQEALPLFKSNASAPSSARLIASEASATSTSHAPTTTPPWVG